MAKAARARVDAVERRGQRASAPASTRRARRSPRRSPLAALLILVAMVSAIGLGRVAIAVQAAEACMDAGRLAREIKSERLAGDRLEIDKNALSTPSRLEGIAGEAMSMAAPMDVRYIPAEELVVEEPAPAMASASAAGSAFLEAVARAAATQAQVLLVGDVGLSAAR